VRRVPFTAGLAVTAVLASVLLSPAPHPAQATLLVGSRIVFTTARDGNYEVYTANPDGSGLVNVSNDPAADSYPAWSPDRTKIAFAATRDLNLEIYVMNADGSGQTRLTNQGAVDFYPAWSPDGTKIAFATNRDGNYEVYVMNADGSAPTRLTFDPAQDLRPAWSPDSTKIAFDTYRDGNEEVYVMNADGSAQTNISNTPGGEDLDPAWSPDGTKIAFGSTRDGNLEVYVMNADGSAPTDVSNHPAIDSDPAWSPDGSQIVYFGLHDGNYDVYVMNADGSGQTDITNDPAIDFFPGWQSPVPGVDSDQDGCADARELLRTPASEQLGGKRNPKLFWDFYDVWTHPMADPSAWERDRVVTLVGDVLGVASRFGSGFIGPFPPPTKAELLAEALTPPTSDAGYHAAYDRGPQSGPDPWDRGPPDGMINIADDILGVAAQFGHSCL